MQTQWDRLRQAQAVVDTVLTREQQAAERFRDGLYRVCCSHCGGAVSNPLPVPVIVRAFVECPDCVARRDAARDDLGAE